MHDASGAGVIPDGRPSTPRCHHGHEARTDPSSRHRCRWAKAFYVEQLGFVADVDVRPADGVRVVQLTPPGSACSIGMGTGLDAYSTTPGTIRALHLVVDDIEHARAELVSRGVDVAAIEDVGGGVRYASFADPDGNTFTLQEMAWRTGDDF